MFPWLQEVRKSTHGPLQTLLQAPCAIVRR